MRKPKIIILIILLAVLLIIAVGAFYYWQKKHKTTADTVQPTTQNSSDFIMTFSPRVLLNGSEDLSTIDQAMLSGLNYAGITILPQWNPDPDSIPSLKNKNYKLALTITPTIHKADGIGKDELVPGNDDTKYLTAPGLDKSKCENWNNKYAIDPAYTGVLWQNDLDNTKNDVSRTMPNVVFFDLELWNGNIPYIESLFSTRDPGQNCNINGIISNGQGVDQYMANWKQRMTDLKNAALEVDPNVKVYFYHELPAGGTRWVADTTGKYNQSAIAYCPVGVGDGPAPSLYILPNLELLQKNIESMNMQNAVPYVSLGYMYGYSKPQANSVPYDPSVAREAGRMLRKAGAKGFYIWPGAGGVYGSINYWLANAKAMVEGFNEGTAYIEKNLIPNPDFEALGTKGETFTSGLVDTAQFIPNYWSWSDSNTSAKDTSAYANLELTDKHSGTYAWEHKRSGVPGTREILSKSFSVEQGKYNFSFWIKSSLASDTSNITASLINTAGTSIEFGKSNFATDWSEIKNYLDVAPGEYQLKIVINDQTNQNVSVLLDGVGLSKEEIPILDQNNQTNDDSSNNTNQDQPVIPVDNPPSTTSKSTTKKSSVPSSSQTTSNSTPTTAKTENKPLTSAGNDPYDYLMISIFAALVTIFFGVLLGKKKQQSSEI